MDKAWIFLLIFLGTLAAAGAVSVWIIQRKLRQVSRSMFGTDSLLEGLEQQEERIAETPRSVSSMTSIYLPQIAKDFPEFSLEEFRKKSENSLNAFLSALETQELSSLAGISESPVSYTHLAYHVEKFEDTIRELERGQADYAVLPIENSTAGFVITNYDLLSRYDNYIVGEIYVPVDHVLLGVPGASVSDVKTVYSHNQALMQCSEYLDSHGDWNQVSVLNTAAAAKKVMEEGDKTQAAVASRTAGELYGLAELKTSISNERGNTTRFLVLSREPVYEKKASKVTVTFEVPHVSGSLYKILGNFIFNGVNMRMIESRPIPDKPFEYRFFVDIEGNLSHAPVHNALAGIQAEASSMKILGNY